MGLAALTLRRARRLLDFLRFALNLGLGKFITLNLKNSHVIFLVLFRIVIVRSALIALKGRSSTIPVLALVRRRRRRLDRSWMSNTRRLSGRIGIETLVSDDRASIRQPKPPI